MVLSLEGKNAIVTGSSGGIGKEIARLFLEQGAKVCLVARNEEPLKELKKDFGDRATVMTHYNILKEDQAMALVDEAEVTMGSVDILVNNAGITKDNLSIRMKMEDWDDVLNINLRTPFILAKACLSKMIRKKYGRIINVSSIVGQTGNAGQANYSASKGGIIALTKSLAKEVAMRNITVNSIAPGFIATKMTEVLKDEQKDGLLKNIPMQRMGSPEEIAIAALFLASKEASYITGQVLGVNGGLFM